MSNLDLAKIAILILYAIFTFAIIYYFISRENKKKGLPKRAGIVMTFLIWIFAMGVSWLLEYI